MQEFVILHPLVLASIQKKIVIHKIIMIVMNIIVAPKKDQYMAAG